MDLKKEILEILGRDARVCAEDISIMVGASLDEVKQAIAEMEQDQVIVQYNTIIDWHKVDNTTVEALIEVKVTPQRGKGFGTIARRIQGFQEVKSIYLMSGAYDLMVLIDGRSMQEIAFFVAEKLSTIEGVLSTATHFMLKKYKENGVVIDDDMHGDGRLVVSP